MTIPNSSGTLGLESAAAAALAMFGNGMRIGLGTGHATSERGSNDADGSFSATCERCEERQSKGRVR